MGITTAIEILREAPKAFAKGQTGMDADDLRGARLERLNEASIILAKAKGDDRAMLASEVRAFDRLTSQANELEGMISGLEAKSEQRAILPASQMQGRGGANRGGQFDQELRAMGTALLAGGAVMVPDDYMAQVWEHLSAEAVLLKAGARVIQTSRSNLLIPRLASDSVASWTAEGAEITESSPTMSGVDAVLSKCAAIVRVSNELVADANPDVVAMIMGQLTRSLSLAVDLAGFEGSGTVNQPKGLSGYTTINLNTSLGADGAVPTDLDEVAEAISSIETANGKPTAIFMHPAIWGVISKIKSDTAVTNNMPLVLNQVGVSGAPDRRLYGVPVFLSSQLSRTETRGSSHVCSSIYVADMSQIVFVKNAQLRLELDRSRLFNSDESEVRGVLRATWAFPNPTAITRIVGVKIS